MFYFMLQEVAKQHTEFQYTLCSSCPVLTLYLTLTQLCKPGISSWHNAIDLSILSLEFHQLWECGTLRTHLSAHQKLWALFRFPALPCSLETLSRLWAGQEESYTHYKLRQTEYLTPVWAGGTVWWAPWSSSGEGNGNPVQYSCLENPMDRGAW